MAPQVRARRHPARRLADPEHGRPDGRDGPPRALAIRLPDALREPGHRLHGGGPRALGELGWSIPTRTSGTSTPTTSSTSPGATPAAAAGGDVPRLPHERADPAPGPRPWLPPRQPGGPGTVPDSPLVRNAGRGLQIALPRICEPPRAEVIQTCSVRSAGPKSRRRSRRASPPASRILTLVS